MDGDIYEIRKAELGILSLHNLADANDSRYWTTRHTVTYVATKDGVVVGFTFAVLSNFDKDFDLGEIEILDEMEILDIVIDPKFRDKKVDSKLLDKLLQTHGIKLFTTMLAHYRTHIIHLFESRGFTIVKRHNSLLDCGVDGIEMQKHQDDTNDNPSKHPKQDAYDWAGWY